MIPGRRSLSCGAAALATVLTYSLNDPVSEHEAAKGMLKMTEPLKVKYRGGFSLLDTQFVTEHLRQFGTIEIDRAEFHTLLEAALTHDADFLRLPKNAHPEHILDIIQGLPVR